MRDLVQRRALSLYQSEETKMLNIFFPRIGIEATTYRVYSSTVVPKDPAPRTLRTLKLYIFNTNSTTSVEQQN